MKGRAGDRDHLLHVHESVKEFFSVVHTNLATGKVPEFAATSLSTSGFVVRCDSCAPTPTVLCPTPAAPISSLFDPSACTVVRHPAFQAVADSSVENALSISSVTDATDLLRQPSGPRLALLAALYPAQRSQWHCPQSSNHADRTLVNVCARVLPKSRDFAVTSARYWLLERARVSKFEIKKFLSWNWASPSTVPSSPSKLRESEVLAVIAGDVSPDEDISSDGKVALKKRRGPIRRLDSVAMDVPSTMPAVW